MFDSRLEQQIGLAQRHSDCPESLADTVRKQEPSLARARGTAESFYLSELADEVQTELTGLAGRLRFEVNRHGILFAKATPLHQIEDLLIQRFAARFPYFIALESSRGTFVGKEGMVERFSEPLPFVLASLERVLPPHPILSRLDSGDREVWESFWCSLPGGSAAEAARPKADILQNLPLRFQPGRGLARFFLRC